MSDETVELLSNSEIEEFYGKYLNTLSLYNQDVNKYPVLPANEQKQLLEDYRFNGNNDSREKLINHNLRLVLSVVHKLFPKSSSESTLLDRIQEGNIGLMTAIEKYDFAYNIAFSSYAVYWIRQVIQKGIINSQSIRISYSMTDYCRRYKKFCRDYFEKHLEEPTKEMIMESLEISEITYNSIIEAMSKNIVSLSSIVGEDSELGEFIPIDGNDFEDKNNEMDLSIILNKAYKVLSPKEYYVIYFYFVEDSKLTLTDIAKELKLTRERIRQIQVKGLNKLKACLEKNEKPNYVEKPYIPTKITTIAKLSYLKELLSPLEYQIIYYGLFYQNHNRIMEIMEYNDYSIFDINRIITNIREQYVDKLNDNHFIELLIDKLWSNHSFAQIMNLNINPERTISYEAIKRFLDSLSLSDIYKSSTFTKKYLYLIDSYYGSIDNLTPQMIENAQREINIKKFGFSFDATPFDKEKLRKYYLDHLDDYDEKQRDVIDCLIFKTKPKSLLDKYKNINNHIIYGKIYYLQKLEMDYYRISSMIEPEISTEEIERIVDNPSYIFTPFEIRMAELYYGIHDTKTMSLGEIAQECNVSYQKVHVTVRSLREKCLRISLSLKTINCKKSGEKYKYILDNVQYVLTDETRKILKMQLLDGKTNEEISKLTKLSISRVSNIILDGIRRMDAYYYGLIKPLIFTEEELNDFYDNSEYSFSSEEKEYIYCRYFLGYTNNMIVNKFHITTRYINDFFKKFNNRFVAYKSASVDVTFEDLFYELNCHSSDSVLNEEQKEIISLFKGIKCKYNPYGEKITMNKIAVLNGITVNKGFHTLYDGIKEVIKRKMNLNEPRHGIITREKMIEIINDPHIPLNSRDIDILKGLKGIESPTYDEKELGKKYNIVPASITRRYQRSVVTLLKYQNNELAGKLDYEIDIKPIRKYFPLFYQNILDLIYRDNNSVKDIQRKYGLTIEQARTIYNKVITKVLLIIKNPDTVKLFDFDYARQVLDNEDLPGRINYDLIKPIYKRYFGDDGNVPEVISEYIINNNLNFQVNIIRKGIYCLLLSICKYRDGFVSPKELPLEEITDFYNNQYDSIPNSYRQIFQRYIFNKPKQHISTRRRRQSLKMIYEVLKQNPEFIHLESLSNEQLMSIIKKYKLSKRTIKVINALCGISSKDSLSHKDKIRLFKKLYPLFPNNHIQLKIK